MNKIALRIAGFLIIFTGSLDRNLLQNIISICISSECHIDTVKAKYTEKIRSFSTEIWKHIRLLFSLSSDIYTRWFQSDDHFRKWRYPYHVTFRRDRSLCLRIEKYLKFFWLWLKLVTNTGEYHIRLKHRALHFLSFQKCHYKTISCIRVLCLFFFLTSSHCSFR